MGEKNGLVMYLSICKLELFLQGGFLFWGVFFAGIFESFLVLGFFWEICKFFAGLAEFAFCKLFGFKLCKIQRNFDIT
jgi:hypothetical protein